MLAISTCKNRHNAIYICPQMGLRSKIANFLWGDIIQSRTTVVPALEVRDNKTSRLDLPEDWLLRSFGAMSGGVIVNEDSALTVSAIYACVRILAESVASLPLKLYQKKGSERHEASNLGIYHLIKEEPNGFQTSFEFREMMQGHLGTRGNAYAKIIRDNRGTPIQLEPLHPASVSVHRSDELGIIYKVKGEVLDQYNVLHLKGLSSDGLNGLSPIALMRDTVGLALNSQKHGLNLYQNGAQPGGVLETAANMSKDQVDAFRKQWNEAHQGASKSGTTAILHSGLTWRDIGFNNVDAQYIESRKFDVEEIARAYRIPLHLLQSTEKSTSWGSGIEQQNIGFLEYTLRPWLVRWEQSLNRSLLTERQKANGFYFRFNLDALLRGDFKTRAEGYRTLIESGVMSINEVRAKEEWNPIGEEGDKHYRPLNTVPADKLGEEQQQEEPVNV